MKRICNSKWLILLLLVGILLLAAGCESDQPRFHDVTIELGTASLGLRDFLAEDADPSKAAFVTDVTQIDLGTVGETSITLRYGRKEETVVLRVQDTTAPAVEFTAHRTEAIGYVPVPEDFIVSISDLSETTCSFKEPFSPPEVYSDMELTVVVADAHGNSVEQICTISYSWMRQSVSLELGTELTKEHILLDAEKDGHLINQKEIDKINNSGEGEFTITATSGESTVTCQITVKDTQGPTLSLRNIRLYPGQSATMDSFIVSVWDGSGDVELKLLTTFNLDTIGTQTIKIQATDKLGHVTVGEATLSIYPDSDPPQFKGLNNMSIAKNSTPDYRVGVSAYDAKDGVCDFTYDASNVDLTKAGTYTVYYSATDRSGNQASGKRTVVVNPDYSDTLALVAQIAQSIPKNDPESLRDYVRTKIRYSSNWGGSDPVYFGFTKFHGNCYVHAMTLKALLDYYGYESHLIWVEPKYSPHYWLIINLNGTWYHIDGTPSTAHSRYSLMTNEMRLATLNGRKWDTSKWPMLYPPVEPEPDEPSTDPETSTDTPSVDNTETQTTPVTTPATEPVTTTQLKPPEETTEP